MGHQERECQHSRKWCISLEEDDYQFGPWLCAVGPKANWGKIFYNQSKSREAEDDESQELDRDDDDKELAPYSCQLQSSPLTKKFFKKTARNPLNETVRILVSQVISKSQNPLVNSNSKQNTCPPNLEKPISHSFSNSKLTENPQQKFLNISPAIMGLRSENLIPTFEEGNSSKNPSTHTYHSPKKN